MVAQETSSDRYTAAAGLASAVSEAAASYGVDIEPLCKALDLDSSIFQDLTRRVSLDRLCRLLETCAILTKDEAFGLKCVDFFRAGSTGPFGFGLMAAPTALDFIKFTSEHIWNVSQVSYSKLTISESAAEFVWTYSPIVLKATQVTDLEIGLLIARLRGIVGSSIEGVEIAFERAKPENLAPFRERLPRRLSFGRRINSMRIPADIWPIANPRGDKRLFRLMELQCESLRPNPVRDLGFDEEFKEFLQHRISDNNVGLSEAARYFHVSERTLQRRLLEHGTSLADARDEVRRELARKYLVETDLSVAEIALRLGYSQPSAFTRSTARWFGTTPRDYRQNSRSTNH